MNEQWAKTCTRHGPYSEPSCQKCQAEMNKTMSGIADSIAEQAHAKEQEKTMTAPTEAQLNDPAWWDRNAPDGAEYVAIAPDDTLIFYRQDSVGAWQIWGVRCRQWLFDGFSHDAGEPPYDLVARPVAPKSERLAQLEAERNAHLAEDEAPERNGEGLPPVGATEKDFRLVGIHHSPKRFEVIAHRNHAAIVFVPSSEDEGDAFPALACHFRPLRTAEQWQREEVIEAALSLDAYPMGRSAGGLMSRHDFCAKLYDAGMLRKGDE